MRWIMFSLSRLRGDAIRYKNRQRRSFPTHRPEDRIDRGSRVFHRVSVCESMHPCHRRSPVILGQCVPYIWHSDGAWVPADQSNGG